MISKIFFDVLIPVPAILDNDADNNNAYCSYKFRFLIITGNYVREKMNKMICRAQNVCKHNTQKQIKHQTQPERSDPYIYITERTYLIIFYNAGCEK